jgi:hypothetical protein
MKTTGCVYFVIKSFRYLDKCIISATSLKKHMPYMRTDLYTDLAIDKVSFSCFDNIYLTETPEHIWPYKYECLLKSPYEHTLHLDSDTYIVEDFSEVFQMLDRFDIVMPLSVHYISSKVSNVPDCFPEPAGGFMVWEKNAKTTKFFEDVRQAKINKRKGSDEPFLRWVLYHSPEIQFGVIPQEYNCVYAHPGYLFGKVKVMHGKRATIVKDAEIFNTNVYEDFPPFKRVFTGNKISFFKKISGTGGTKMRVVQEVSYSTEDFVSARGAG